MDFDLEEEIVELEPTRNPRLYPYICGKCDTVLILTIKSSSVYCPQCKRWQHEPESTQKGIVETDYNKGTFKDIRKKG